MATLSSRNESNSRRARPTLLVLGVHVASDAYPNVHHKVRALTRLPGSREINVPLPMSLLSRRSVSRLQRIAVLSRFVVSFVAAHLRVLGAYLRTPVPATLYVPYPSAGVLWLLSWLPRTRRPGRVVADTFISMYDTVVEDRQLVPASGLAARLLRSFERRAYHHADTVITDTEPNVEYLRNTFGLTGEKVASMPLSIDEMTYQPTQYGVSTGLCTVLFIGTFVPLQGAQVIAHSIALLADHPGVRFRLIGYGQSAPQVESILAASGASNWSWEKAWQSSAALAEEVRSADVCLGIFGSGAKTQRVWPLKNYAYMAVGRALVTADTRCAREFLAQAESPPFVTVPIDNPAALAKTIVALAGDSAWRRRLATAGQAFYDEHLRSEISIHQLERLVRAPGPG